LLFRFLLAESERIKKRELPRMPSAPKAMGNKENVGLLFE